MLSIESGLTPETAGRQFSAPDTAILNIQLYPLVLLMH